MKATFARVIVVVATAGSITVVGPRADAATDLILGGCHWDTTAGSGNTQAGVIGDASFTQDAAEVPTDATVTCKIQVNGTDAPGTTFTYSGFGVQAGADNISYVATDSDVVQICQRVVYADGEDTGWTCKFSLYIELPPQAPDPGPIDAAFEYVIDPQVCPRLVDAAGTYGPVTIGPDGDVYIPDPLGFGIGWVYDCPPYGNF